MGKDNRNEQEIVFLAYNGMFCFRIISVIHLGSNEIGDNLGYLPQLQYSILPTSLIITWPGTCIKYKMSIVSVVIEGCNLVMSLRHPIHYVHYRIASQDDSLHLHSSFLLEFATVL